MRRLALIALTLCCASPLFAHLIVDVRMTIDAASFAPIGQPFTYHIIADDLANDPGYGVVVMIGIPSSATAPSASASGWNCAQSGNSFRCSAEQIQPGPNPITVQFTTPSRVSSLSLTTTVQTIGSYDPNPSNDSATQTIVVYDPQQCSAAPPTILAPAAGSEVAGSATFSWTAVPGAAIYRVFTAREGEKPASAATTQSTNVTLPFLLGQVDWWVQAEFDNCPAVAATSQRFTNTTSGVTFRIFNFAGHADVDNTVDGSLDVAAFRMPYGLALSAPGDLYVSDALDDVIRHITNGEVKTTTGAASVTGSADGQFALFDHPHGITLTPHDGFVHVADTSNDSIRIVETGGPFAPAFTTAGAAGQPGFVDGGADQARLRQPMSITATERGTLFVADSGNGAIRKMTQVSGFVGAFTTSTLAAGFNSPQGIAVADDGTVYVAEANAIRRIDSAGAITTLASGLGNAVGITVDSRGNVYITDLGDQAVKKIAPSGLMTTLAGGFNDPVGIAVDANGTIYVADSKNHRIVLLHAEATAIPRKRAAGH